MTHKFIKIRSLAISNGIQDALQELFSALLLWTCSIGALSAAEPDPATRVIVNAQLIDIRQFSTDLSDDLRRQLRAEGMAVPKARPRLPLQQLADPQLLARVQLPVCERISFLVDHHGKPSDVRLHNARGLDDPANQRVLAQLSLWTFEPAELASTRVNQFIGIVHAWDLPKAQSFNACRQAGAYVLVDYPQTNATPREVLQRTEPPRYPINELRNGEDGCALLLAYIAPDGQVVDSALLAYRGSRNIGLSAMMAMRSWRYAPGETSWLLQTIHCAVKGAPRDDDFDCAGLIARTD